MCGKTTNWKMRNVKEKRGIFIMKQKAMDMKLVVKPLVGCLTHTHFWEGPCRAGHKEDMTVEAETKAADEAFKNSVKGLQGVIDEVEFTEPVDVRYNESFVVDKDLFAKIGEDVDEIDCFLCMGWRIPKLERFGKPVVIWQNGNEGIDFAAYCRSIGVEAYVCMDLQDVNEIMHILWVRKAVRNTRALVLTAGSQPTFGIQSLIRDPEILRQRYGVEVVKLPFTSIFKYMDEITDEEAKPIADKIIAGSTDTQVNTDWFINDVKYYLAAKKMMDIYDCNAFSTACHELCTTEIPQNRKFTPCMCHSIMKDEGIPSGCEEQNRWHTNSGHSQARDSVENCRLTSQRTMMIISHLDVSIRQAIPCASRKARLSVLNMQIHTAVRSTTSRWTMQENSCTILQDSDIIRC